MTSYPLIREILSLLFNNKDSLDEEFSVDAYKSNINRRGKLVELKAELQSAFSDPRLSWREMLFNSEYEVFDYESEVEAREFAERILWKPLYEGSAPEDGS